MTDFQLQNKKTASVNKDVKISILTSLYKSENFLSSYFEALSQLRGKDVIEVLLLHNEPNAKELEIIAANLQAFDFVRHIIIEERESLYKTWNRGICLSKGEYITVWNVDDVRFPGSVLQQAKTLDQNPEAAISYGDIYLSKEYGVHGNKRTNSPDNNEKKDFFHAYHITCFQMWRKIIHKEIGYYDEQFYCSADLDFQIRAAIHYPFVKTKDILGIYLEAQPHKISSTGPQSLENNIIHLRYGAYQRLNFSNLYLSKKKYQIKKQLFFNEWHIFAEKSQFGRMYKFRGLIIAFFNTLLLLTKTFIKKLILYDNAKR